MTRRDLQIKDLNIDSLYAVQIRGKDAEGNPGPWSSTFEFSTSRNMTPPAKVEGLTLHYDQDGNFFFGWDHVTTDADGGYLSNLRDYVVTVSNGFTTSREFYITIDQFVFTLAMNRDAFGTPSADLEFTIRARTTALVTGESNSISGLIPPPVAPTITADGRVNMVRIMWEREAGIISHYVIFKNGEEYDTAGPSTTVWGDGDPGPGVHDYFVRVVDVFGRYADSNTVSEAGISIDFILDVMPPKPPTNPAGTSTLGITGERRALATVSWDAPVENEDDSDYTDHEGFTIRFRVSQDRPWSYIQVPDDRASGTASARFEAEIPRLVPGATLFWGVRAFDRLGNASEWLNHSFGLVVDDTPPLPPILLGAEGGIRTISASWKPDDAEENPISGYRVYAAQSPNVSRTPANLRYDGLGTVASFIVGDAETWYVRVTAYRRGYGGDVYESAVSNELSATSWTFEDDTEPPSNVNGLSATPQTYYHGASELGRVLLSWTAATDNVGVNHYVIRHRPQGGDWTEALSGSESTHYAISGLEPGTTYEFQVKAVDHAGNRSEQWSSTATVGITTNGAAIREEVYLTTGGAIQSDNYNPATPSGYRLGSDGLEIYGTAGGNTSIILGSNGLNINSVTGQLWFGHSQFANAAFRVDNTGRARFGTSAQGIHLWEDGSLRIGDTGTTAPVYITNQGAATFRNIRITGENLPNGQALIQAGNMLVVQKTSGGSWQTRLAGDMFIDAGGNLQMNGGAITLTSGNFAMNGGIMTMAGGQMNLTGTPVKLAGSNLTVESGNIIIDGGLASSPTPTGVIRSANYNYNNRTGWALDNGNLYLFDGEIDASLINVREASPNLLDHGYTQFSFDPDWYAVNTVRSSTTGFTATQSGVWARYGGNSFRLQNTSGASRLVYMTPNTATANVRVESGAVHTFSAYVHNNGGASVQVGLGYRQGTTNTLVSGLQTLAAGETRRIHGTFTPTANNIAVYLTINNNGDALFDGLQVEPSDQPSFFKTGGVTTISGSMIKTGTIQSTATTIVDGQPQPTWSLSTAGNLVAYNATISGTIIIGSKEASVYISDELAPVDTKATDALSAADDASTTATNAQNTATNANTTANTALNTANTANTNAINSRQPGYWVSGAVASGINIRSASFNTGNPTNTVGWGIYADGSAFFHNVFARGNILANSVTASISIETPTITGGTIQTAQPFWYNTRVTISTGDVGAVTFHNGSNNTSSTIRQGNAGGLETSGSFRVGATGGTQGGGTLYTGAILVGASAYYGMHSNGNVVANGVGAGVTPAQGEVRSSGHIRAGGTILAEGHSTTNNSPNVHMSTAGQLFRVNVGAIGTNHTHSLRKLKNNIRPAGIEDAAGVLDLQLVLHEWNKPEERGYGDKFGLIAEDVEAIDPRLAVYLDEELIGVHYDRIGPMLQPFVKKHEQEIDELKAEVAELKELVRQLAGA